MKTNVPWLSPLSTPSLGITMLRAAKVMFRNAAGFQLPLSGSRHLSSTSRCFGLNSFQLPLSGSLIDEVAHADEVGRLSTPSLGITVIIALTYSRNRHADHTFNSLSRDHTAASQDRVFSLWAYPFNSLSRDHCQLIMIRAAAITGKLSTPSLGITTEQQVVFMLPGLPLLSTPSLGITQ